MVQEPVSTKKNFELHKCIYVMQLRLNNRSKQYVYVQGIYTFHRIKKTCYSWSVASLSEVSPSKSPLALGAGLSEAGHLERHTGEKKLVTFV